MAEEPNGSPQKPEDDGVLRMTKSQMEKYITEANPSSPDFDMDTMQRLITGDRVEVVDEASADDKGEPAPAPEQNPEQQEPSKEPEKAPEKPQEPAPENPDPDKGPPDVDALTKRNQWLAEERDKVMKETDDLRSTVKDLQKQMEALKKQPKEEKKEEPSAPPAPKVDVPQSRMEEIKKLRQEIEDMPTDDKVAGTEQYLKKLDKLNELNVYEQDRLDKQIQSLQTSQNPEVQELKSQLQQAVEKINKLSEADKTRAEEFEAAKVKDQQRQQMEAALKEVEEFQTDNEQFKTSKPLLEVEKEYIKWANDLARLKYGRYATSQEELSAAIVAFQQEDPTLLSAATNAGLVKSNDVATYMDVMDIWRIKKALPQVNGKEATFKSALKYRMNETGETDQAMLDAKKAGLDMAKKAMAQSPNTARQLPHDAPADTENITGEMTKEQAKEIMNSYNAVEAFKNPAINVQMKKAMEVLGAPAPMIELLKTK